MTVKIEIYGESAKDALKELGDFAGGLTRPVGLQPVMAAPYSGGDIGEQTAAALTGDAQNGPRSEKPVRRTRKAAEPAPPAETPVDDAEVEAQDADDEQAEVEEERDDKAPLTTEDVKAAMSGYVKAFGMQATQEDGPKIFTEALGKPPEGEPYWKLSLLADADQATFAKVIDVWTKATTLNPLKRTPV